MSQVPSPAFTNLTPTVRPEDGLASALTRNIDALAERLAGLPPLGLAAIKSMIRTTGSRTLDEELDLQRDEMRRLGFTKDYREGVAAFLEKRPPTFTGE